MNFKSFLAFIIIFISVQIGIAQDYKNEIKTEFLEYLNSLLDKDFENSVEYILPEFFSIVPKDQMIRIMDQTFNNPEMIIELKNPKVLKIGNAQKIESKYYVILSYSNNMNMRFLELDINDSDEIEMMTHTMVQTFGSENVKYIDETGFYEIYSVKQVCAISKDGSSDWKFLVLEKSQKEILKRVLPSSIINEIL
ncbi:MAG: hypothetical protein RIA62_09890 [Cyclobacteriaceae bacterium]